MWLFPGFLFLWLDIAFAVKECWDKNAEYNECGSACEPSCGTPPVEVCIEMCVSGCFCKAGFIKDYRGMCISEQECSAFLDSSECLTQLSAVSSAVGAFVPSCDKNGNFSVKQCHGSTGYCWCAHRNGTKIENTEIRGNPKCTRELTCEESRDADLAMIAGVNGMITDFSPADCENGSAHFTNIVSGIILSLQLLLSFV